MKLVFLGLVGIAVANVAAHAGADAVMKARAKSTHQETAITQALKQSPSRVYAMKQVNRGPLSADLSRDASARMIRNEERHHAPHTRSTNARLDHSPASSRAVQAEVEHMVARMRNLHDNELMATFAEELENVEAAEEALAAKAGDVAMVEQIDKMRAELCLVPAMHAKELLDCDQFMRKACVPNVTHFASVSKDNCTSFFVAEARAEANRTGAVKGPLLDVLKAISRRQNSIRVGAPAPAAAPGAAPGPAPAGDILGGKAWEPAPEQGYHGEYVLHVNKETMTDDWRKEFGPKSGHRSFLSICGDHPDNEWCRLHGYYPKEAEKFMKPLTKDGAGSKSVSVAVLLTACVTALL